VSEETSKDPSQKSIKAEVLKIPIEDVEASLFECREGSDLTELTRSIEKVGVIEPIIVRPKANGKYELVAGDRRIKASKCAGLKEIPGLVRELSDEEAFVFQVSENLQRTDLTDKEKTNLVVYCAEKYKWKPKEIAQKLSMGVDWVYTYLPSQYKDQVKAEAGKAGGEATQEERKVLDAVKQTVKTQDKPQFVQCSCCPMGTYSPQDWKGKPVCPSCYVKLSQGEITLKEPVAIVEKPSVEVHEYKPKETAEQRKAVMSPGVSKMDEAVFLALQQNEVLRSAGWKFEFQKRYCIKRVRSDVTAFRGDVEQPLFLDGEVHIGREERDEENRGLLARRLKIPEVYAFSYEGAYSDAKRDEIVAKIVEKLM
jgi:ParB/RepB/Spo0J family partition protein